MTIDTIDAIHIAVKNSNLGFLHGREGKPYTTTKELRATTHGADMKGDFISCLVGSAVLPAGTEGLVFQSKKLTYSKMKWVGDMELPAAGADIIQTGYYTSLCTLLTLPSGNTVLVDVFSSVDHEPKIIGKV